MNGFVFSNNEWVPIASIHCFHEGIGFVKLHSVKVCDNGEWKVIQLSGDRQLVGAYSE